jgi:hypothetical protein
MDLFAEVEEARGNKKSVSATAFAAKITANKEFAKGQQADAHEAFMLIISRLLDACLEVGDGSGQALEANEYATKERLERSSLVGNVYGMDLGQNVCCDNCGYESPIARVEYCLCLSVTLGLTDRERLSTDTPDTTLEALLREYTKGEHIEGYRCDKCSVTKGCTRTAYIARPPNVLMVYINRRQDSGLYGKINRRVRFSQHLDLAQFVRYGTLDGRGAKGSSSQPCNYSLYAVVVHRDVNRSTFCGHYFAYIRDKTSQWYLLDDTRVEQARWPDVQEQHAYLLLYSKDTYTPIPDDVSTFERPSKPRASQSSAALSSTGSGCSVACSRASVACSSSSGSGASSTSARGSSAASWDPLAPSSGLFEGSTATASVTLALAEDEAGFETGAEAEAAEAETQTLGSEARVEKLEEILARLDQEDQAEAEEEISRSNNDLFDFDALDAQREEDLV